MCTAHLKPNEGVHICNPSVLVRRRRAEVGESLKAHRPDALSTCGSKQQEKNKKQKLKQNKTKNRLQTNWKVRAYAQGCQNLHTCTVAILYTQFKESSFFKALGQ